MLMNYHCYYNDVNNCIFGTSFTCKCEGDRVELPEANYLWKQ